MDKPLKPLAAVLQLNSRLFQNCLADVDEKSALSRVSERKNHMAFIAAHLVDSRYYLAGCIGIALDNPMQDFLKDAQDIADITQFPPLDLIHCCWQEVSGRLLDRFGQLTTAELQAEASQSFPVEDPTLLGAIAFLLQHDSYHIGQLAFLRKHSGLAPMSYR